jgi:uncharacterized protein
VTNEYSGLILKQAFKAGEKALEKRIDEINGLNVFPVPDGDTGINMFLTMQAANGAVENLDSVSAGEICGKIARGALLGARGNSGVILSQILRGLAKGLGAKQNFTVLDFAAALRLGAESAYSAIAQPVEGTILTVMREAAEAAQENALQGGDLKEVLGAAVSQARASVRNTPDLLPRLREAGVVDAGGKGLYYLLQGMQDQVGRRDSARKKKKGTRLQAELASVQASYGFDLQFLVEGGKTALDEIRPGVESMGESVLVVGDANLFRVHVHTRKPDAVMDYCRKFGELKDIVKENMDLQVKQFEKRTVRSVSLSK